jgi:putative Mn2+ efflux pump MntP
MLHASTSVAVAAVALAIGLVITKSYLSYMYDAGEVLLVIVGLYFILNGLRERKKSQKVEALSTNSALAVSIFPDFALVPILISATPLGFSEISILIIVFVSVSALSLSVIVLVASIGITSAVEKLEPRVIDYVMGIILFITAAILRFL